MTRCDIVTAACQRRGLEAVVAGAPGLLDAWSDAAGALDAVVALCDDAVPRVRAAASRAVATLTATGA